MCPLKKIAHHHDPKSFTSWRHQSSVVHPCPLCTIQAFELKEFVFSDGLLPGHLSTHWCPIGLDHPLGRHLLSLSPARPSNLFALLRACLIGYCGTVGRRSLCLRHHSRSLSLSLSCWSQNLCDGLEELMFPYVSSAAPRYAPSFPARYSRRMHMYDLRVRACMQHTPRRQHVHGTSADSLGLDHLLVCQSHLSRKLNRCFHSCPPNIASIGHALITNRPVHINQHTTMLLLNHSIKCTRVLSTIGITRSRLLLTGLLAWSPICNPVSDDRLWWRLLHKLCKHRMLLKHLLINECESSVGCLLGDLFELFSTLLRAKDRFCKNPFLRVVVSSDTRVRVCGLSSAEQLSDRALLLRGLRDCVLLGGWRRHFQQLLVPLVAGPAVERAQVGGVAGGVQWCTTCPLAF